MKISIKDFFSQCHQIQSFLRIWPHLLKKSLMENFIFGAVKAKTFRSTEHPFPMLRNAMTNALFTLKLLLFFGVVLKCCRKILST